MPSKSDADLEADIVERMIRDEIEGNNKTTVDTLKGNGFKTSDQGRVEEIIRDLAKDRKAPVRMYGGGARDNVQLTSIPDAREWLKEKHNWSPWWE